MERRFSVPSPHPRFDPAHETPRLTIEQKSLSDLVERLDRIETMLIQLQNERQAKEWYSTAEVAEKVGRAEFTVREWCRNGRVGAVKERYGRGRALEWRISHEELQRILNHGPLPLNQKQT